MDVGKDPSMHPLLWMLLAGTLTGIGQLLASKEELSLRIIVGRALSSAALGAVGALSLAWLPAMPIPALIGLSCALASLGTSGLEKIVQRFLGIK